MSRFLTRIDHSAIVYVVDDDESVRRSLAHLLHSAGLAVETFESGQAFLSRAGADRPACVILDMRLAESSGLDVQTALGQRQETMPVVFLTGYAEVAASVRALKNGALDFLEKPCHDEELLDAVRRALARSREACARAEQWRSVQRRIDTLTRREREVMSLVVTGLLNKQIAAELGAAEKTIKIHRGRMMRKMQADSVAQLVRMAGSVGLGPAEPTRTGTDG